MSQQEIKSEIERILDHNKVGTMATVQNGKPHSRYMTFFRDGLTLYTATDKDTHKVDELNQNPFTHILLGYEGEGVGDEFVEFEGRVQQSDSEEIKKKVWNPHLENWFSGPNDPNLLILEIIPEQISLMNKKDLKRRLLEL
ncbi:pyridoxamine 5'-phosphate oxidase family protein [Ornithinibacillus halotolerans]|uniref:General stress protein 26 n=1 Tax=Ornithinibacillus halotolerans TaxID=1274357 RepID=A0A916RXD1_9BACI|nr:pyridoxamine 5'-phosphate oxidase family protein [Ornithinibacillus halotolerans]GGA73998.1 general stress protein 26 [Ornithinibacillus halotolerans]